MDSKFKQAILTFIASQVITQKERSELQKVFQMLDKDGNGTLTRDELRAGYLQIFPHKNAEVEVARIIGNVDANKSGRIDFTEFVVAAMNREKNLGREKLEQVFRIFDKVLNLERRDNLSSIRMAMVFFSSRNYKMV